MIALNFLSDTIDTRTPLRFSMIAEHTHALDLEGPAFHVFMQQLKRNDIVVDPTVSIFEGMLASKAGEPDPSFASILARLPVQVQRGFYGGGLPIPDGKEDQYKASYDKLCWGSYGRCMNMELLLCPEQTPWQVLGCIESWKTMSVQVFQLLMFCEWRPSPQRKLTEMDGQLGSIEAGKLADLILVNGNPCR